MRKYIIRKEYFGGIVADVSTYTINQISAHTYSMASMAKEFQLDHQTRFYSFSTNAGVLSAPLSVTIYPSLKCNIMCEFCFVNPIKHKYINDMTFSQFCHIVDMLQEAGIVDIEIMGGEPFLLPWIVDGIKYVCDAGVHCSINTNVTVLHEEVIKELSSINNLSLRLSIQDDFTMLPQKTRDILSCCSMFGMKVDILSVLQLKNHKQLYNLVKKLPKDIVKHLIILYCDPPPGENAAYDINTFNTITNELILFSQKHKYVNVVAKGPFGHCNMHIEDNELTHFVNGQCLACTSRFEIMPTGDVLPCVKYYHSNQYLLGNVFNENITDIWNGESAVHFRKKIASANMSNQCLSCEWGGKCSGCIGYAEGLGERFDNRCPNKR